MRNEMVPLLLVLFVVEAKLGPLPSFTEELVLLPELISMALVLALSCSASLSKISISARMSFFLEELSASVSFN